MTVTTPDDQREALAVLAPVLPRKTYLVGGVAVASHLHHRRSLDIDLFVAEQDLSRLPDRLAKLPGVIITARGDDVVHLTYNGIPATILRYDYPVLVPPGPVDDLPVPVADPLDLACMKLSAITSRGARRDFWDLHALLARDGAWSLSALLEAFARKYAAEDVGHVVKSLVYFADAELEPLPLGLDERRWQEIKSDLIARVRDL